MMAYVQVASICMIFKNAIYRLVQNTVIYKMNINTL